MSDPNSPANSKQVPTHRLANAARQLLSAIEQYELFASPDDHAFTIASWSLLNSAASAAVEVEKELEQLGFGPDYPCTLTADLAAPVVTGPWLQYPFAAIDALRRFLHQVRGNAPGYARQPGGLWWIPVGRKLGENVLPDFGKSIQLLQPAVKMLEESGTAPQDGDLLRFHQAIEAADDAFEDAYGLLCARLKEILSLKGSSELLPLEWQPRSANMDEALRVLHEALLDLGRFVFVPPGIGCLNTKHDLYLASPHGEFPRPAEESLNEWLGKYRKGPVGDTRFWREVIGELAEPAERFRTWIHGVRENYNRQVKQSHRPQPDSTSAKSKRVLGMLLISGLSSETLQFPIHEFQGSAEAGQGQRFRVSGSIPKDRLPDLIAVGRAIGQAPASTNESNSATDQIEWTRPDSPKCWAKLFGCSPSTFTRRCREAKIRHKKLSTKSYQVAIDDLPTIHQAKFRSQPK